MQGTDGPTTLNDLNLYEEDGATLVTVLIEYPDLATRDMILATGMVDGMEASYARLERPSWSDVDRPVAPASPAPGLVRADPRGDRAPRVGPAGGRVRRCTVEACPASW